MGSWSRPYTVQLPTVWASFEGKETDGATKKKFWIQDVTDDYKDEIIHYMTTGFLKETPIYRYSNFTEDAEAVEDYAKLWRKMLDDNVSLICLTKDNKGDTIFVGCNVHAVSTKSNKYKLVELMKGKTSKLVAGALSHIWGIKDVFLELNTDTYLSACGLYILPEFRSQGIAYHLLKARREIALAVGIKVSVTAFSSLGGQKVAEKLGFKDLIEFPLKDLEKVNPLFKFPGIESDPTKTIRVMYKRY